VTCIRVYNLIDYRFCPISHRKELQGLIPPLDPLYTVKQSMKAILGDQQMICIPRLMYIPLLTRA